MKFDKKKLKEDFDKILGITKDNAEKLWEGTLSLVDKGSHQYHILKLQKNIYFIQRKIDKIKSRLGAKAYKLYKTGKITIKDIKPFGFDIDILLDEIHTIEKDIHKLKEEMTAGKTGKAGKSAKGKKAKVARKSPKKKSSTKTKSKTGSKAKKPKK
ncbi:hypothetical protein KAU33_11865 [Candidatus Dependentiae bacterium]|nr:hypothetical protein [Candidatus Dependentiae bacterium]